MTPLPAGHLAGAGFGAPQLLNANARHAGERSDAVLGTAMAGHYDSLACGVLLDLGFTKLDVLFRHRIVFLLHQLIGHGARILPRHVIEPGIGAGNQLNLDSYGFRHGRTSKSVRFAVLAVNLVAKPSMSRRSSMSRNCQRDQSIS